MEAEEGFAVGLQREEVQEVIMASRYRVLVRRVATHLAE